MLIIMLSITVISLSAVLFHRYWPVSVKRVDLDEVGHFPIIDVRDYQDAYHLPLHQAIQMPCGYISRNAANVPAKKVYIAAGNSIECNVAVRMLKRYGVEVKGCICMRNSR
ncbi:hypothetical protein [Bacillus xiapuensis]|uniref:hypothetical protein n=1 Tax=Bacillus xiapuensis TaxID=2014075 RepID=UPI000C24548E|nr:hypothetical protein [Bacillus xiapuensis]